MRATRANFRANPLPCYNRCRTILNSSVSKKRVKVSLTHI